MDKAIFVIFFINLLASKLLADQALKEINNKIVDVKKVKEKVILIGTLSFFSNILFIVFLVLYILL